jgi:hypothetical protein
MSPPKVVHAQEDLGLSPDHFYFDGTYKIPDGVWRSNAEHVVRLNLNRATQVHLQAGNPPLLHFLSKRAGGL